MGTVTVVECERGKDGGNTKDWKEQAKLYLGTLGRKRFFKISQDLLS